MMKRLNEAVEIRWHGRGGQGAKTACLLLADVAFSSGKHVQGFPEYGPERMGALIINSKKTPEEIRKLVNGYKGRVCVVDAEKISMETLGKNFPNTPMLAAVVKISNVIDNERFINDMRESFQHKFAHKENLIEGNMKALVKAMEEVKVG